jgi:ectoine hydroxylase-related dioxygenase (phytanoyl-CoA dioxygenase family)
VPSTEPINRAPESSTPVWLHSLNEQGFALLSNVIPAGKTAELVSQINGVLQQRLADVDSKPGYALRHLTKSVPAVNTLARSLAITSLVGAAIGPHPFIVRSLFFDKTPGANWKVAWHQDLTIAVREKIEAPGFRAWSVKEGVIHVQPPASVLESMLTLRLHLDDCSAENGALQVLPGSHRSGLLNAEEISRWRENVAPTALEIPAGGAILMKPLLLHASSPALRPSHRRVIHLEFASTNLPCGLKWAAA